MMLAVVSVRCIYIYIYIYVCVGRNVLDVSCYHHCLDLPSSTLTQ
jgi:hypothetical protein